jgi:hypothetical protein
MADDFEPLLHILGHITVHVVHTLIDTWLNNSRRDYNGAEADRFIILFSLRHVRRGACATAARHRVAAPRGRGPEE